MAAPDLPIGTRPLLFQEQVIASLSATRKDGRSGSRFYKQPANSGTCLFPDGQFGRFSAKFSRFPRLRFIPGDNMANRFGTFPRLRFRVAVFSGGDSVKCPEFLRIARGIPGLSPGHDMPYFALTGGWNPDFERCLPILSLSRLRYFARYGLPVGIIATSACNFQTCCRYRGR